MVQTLSAQFEQVLIDGSECYVSAEFLDVNGIPYIPTSVQYRIDDETNAITVVQWTPVGVATQISITINTTVNTMNVLSLLRERRQVLLQVGIPGGSSSYASTTYSLIRKVGTP